MATQSAYKTVSASWGSAGYDGLDATAWAALALTYTIASTVTPDPVAELAAKNAYLARAGRAANNRTVRAEDGDVVDLAVYSARIHVWINQASIKRAVHRAYGQFRHVAGSGHMIRIEYDDATDLIRTIGGPLSGVSQVRLSSCTVVEEFTRADIEAGYGQ